LAIFSHYLIEIRRSADDSLARTVTDLAEPRYTYKLADNAADHAGVPSRTFKVYLFRVDDVGTRSEPQLQTITNPAPATPSVVITPTIGGFQLTASPGGAGTDHAGLKVWLSVSSGFTPAPANLYYQGAGTEIFVPSSDGTPQFIVAALYDTLSDEDLNSSAEYEGAPLMSEAALATAALVAAEAMAAVLQETEDRLAEIAAETAARVAALGLASDALDQEVTDRQAAVQATADDLFAEALTRLNADQASDLRVDAVVSSVADNAAAVVTEASTRSSETGANAGLITALQTSMGEAEAAIVSNATASSDADTAIATNVSSLQTSMGAAQTDIIAVSEALVTESDATALSLSGLQTDVEGNAADILTNATAVSDETSARTSALGTMQTEVNDAAAAIITEASTRSGETGANAGNITTLQTSMGEAEAAIVSNATASSDETEARAAETTLLTARMSNAGFTSDFSSQYPGLFSGDYEGADGSISIENTAPEMGTTVITDVGSVLTTPADGTDFLSVYLKKAAKIEVGKRYRMEITARITGTPTGPWTNRAISGWFRKMDETFTATSVQSAHWYPEALDTWETFSIDWVATAGNAYMRYGFYKRGDYGVTGGDVEVRSISFTEEGFGIQENEASITSEASVRSAADIAHASDISGLQTSMGEAEAAIVSNATAVSTETSARATDVSQLRVSMRGSEGFTLGFDAGLDDFMHGYSGEPITASPVTDWAIHANGNIGNLAWTASGSGNNYLTPRAALPNVAGRRYKFRARFRTTGTTGFNENALTISARSLDINYDYVSVISGEHHQFTGQYAWTDVALDIECDGATPYIRVVIMSRSDWTSGTGDIETDRISFEEVGAVAQELEASISDVSDVAIDAQGRATAMFGLRTDVNGYISGFGLSNDGVSSAFVIIADNFQVARTGAQGGPVALFAVQADGTVVMQNAIIGSALISELVVDKLTGGSLDADITLEGTLNLGGGKIVFDNGVFMKVQGVSFGASSDLIEWYGPSGAVSSCTKANAITYLGTDGSAYFGGTLTAGVLTNSVTGSSIAVPSETFVGPFGTNGDPIVVVHTYSFIKQYWREGNQSNGVSGSTDATLKLWQTIGSGSEVLIGTRTVDGNHVTTFDPTLGQTDVLETMSGSWTYTDNVGGTLPRVYRWSLEARSTVSVSGTSVGGAQDTIDQQRTTIVCVE
jgi:hypothetical protein